MSSLCRCVVILAALALLVVLITPVADELPCTAGHKSTMITALLAAVALPLTPEPSANSSSMLRRNSLHVIEDMRSLSCALLC